MSLIEIKVLFCINPTRVILAIVVVELIPSSLFIRPEVPGLFCPWNSLTVANSLDVCVQFLPGYALFGPTL